MYRVGKVNSPWLLQFGYLAYLLPEKFIKRVARKMVGNVSENNFCPDSNLSYLVPLHLSDIGNLSTVFNSCNCTQWRQDTMDVGSVLTNEDGTVVNGGLPPPWFDRPGVEQGIVTYMSRVEAFVIGIKSNQAIKSFLRADQGIKVASELQKSKNQERAVATDPWPIKNQAIKSFRRDDQAIRHTFCWSKILIPVANASTYNWLPLVEVGIVTFSCRMFAIGIEILGWWNCAIILVQSSWSNGGWSDNHIVLLATWHPIISFW